MTIFVNAMDLVAVGLYAAMVAVVVVLAARRAIRQARCSHERYFETGACDAVCSACGKNLGFIGRVRKERAAIK